MKIFISWSGKRSRAVAELLDEWIRCVLQAARPWISTRDIDRGAVWFSEINNQLQDTSVGIICLTQENKTAPWILFEAGALTKGLPTNRVCPLLIDLKTSDVKNPLAQLNASQPTEDGMWELVRTLNSSCGDRSLDERILSQVFNTYWPQFKQKFDAILKEIPQTEEVKSRPPEDVLTEILENTRSLASRVRALESKRSGAHGLYARRVSVPNAIKIGEGIKSGVSSRISAPAQSWVNGSTLERTNDGDGYILLCDAQDEPSKHIADEIVEAFDSFGIRITGFGSNGPGSE